MTSKGYRLSEAHKGKISLANRGRKLSESHKRLMSIMMQGNKHALGYRHTDESKEKMSAVHEGQIPWNKGSKHGTTGIDGMIL